MRRTSVILLLAASSLLAWASVHGCTEDPMFSDCPFSKSIDQSCSSDDPTIGYTCVVGSHPYCEEEICATWAGSVPFCSRVCAGDSDCPAGSTCQTYLETSFCVPDSISGESRVPPPPPDQGEFL